MKRLVEFVTGDTYLLIVASVTLGLLPVLIWGGGR